MSAGIESTASSFAVVVAAHARSGSVPTKFSRQLLKRGAMLPPLWQTPALNTPVSPSESPSVSTNTLGLGVGAGEGVGLGAGVGQEGPTQTAKVSFTMSWSWLTG